MDQAKYIFLQLTKAVHCIHFNWILHRDIKPGNILLVHDYDVENFGSSYKCDIIICDFGTSTFVSYGEKIYR